MESLKTPYKTNTNTNNLPPLLPLLARNITPEEKFKDIPKDTNFLDCYPFEATLCDDDLKYIANNFPNLETLEMTCCKGITNQGIYNLLPLSNTLKHLNIEDCPELNIIESLDALCQFYNLESLSFSISEEINSDKTKKEEITHKIIELLQACSNLIEIYSDDKYMESLHEYLIGNDKIKNELNIKDPTITPIPCAGSSINLPRNKLNKQVFKLCLSGRSRSNSAAMPPSPTEEGDLWRRMRRRLNHENGNRDSCHLLLPHSPHPSPLEKTPPNRQVAVVRA
jgi:hypothetical protein